MWWPQLDPREVLLWMADPERVRRLGQGVLTVDEAALLAVAVAVLTVRLGHRYDEVLRADLRGEHP